MLPNASLLKRVIKLSGYPVLGIFVLVAVCFLRIANKACSQIRAYEVQEELCSMYHRHMIDGNMCSALCDKKQLSLDYCANNRARVGRKDVLVMKCPGCDIDKQASKIVMKIQVTYSKWNKMAKTILDNTMSIDSMLNQTKNFTKHLIKVNFDTNYFVTEEDILSDLLSDQFRERSLSIKNYKATYVALKTILALVMQPEFVTLLAFKKTSFMPKLYGYCGPAYFVEFTPSINSLSYVVTYNTKSSDLLNIKSLKVRPWHDRAQVALQFLDIIRQVEVLSKKPLQICDFKPHNFGMDVDNNIVLLDSDDCSFDMRHEGRRCNIDDDCVYNYCSSYCDKSTNRCINKRKNNNLQSACQYLFLGDLELFGLLRSPPEVVRETLSDVLQRCSYPEKFNKSAVTSKVDFEVLNHLETVLKKSINV